MQNYKPHIVLCEKLDGFTELCTTVHFMAGWEWKTIEPRVSQSSLSVTSTKKRLQIKWPQGALRPTGMVSHGQKLQRNKSLLVLAAASSCSTPLVGKENVPGGGRQMIIQLQKSLLGVAYDRSNHGSPWEGENPGVQKRPLKRKRNPIKGNKYRAVTLPRSKKFPWQAKALMAAELFPRQGRKKSETATGEISHPIWLSKHSWQLQGKRSLNNRDHLKVLYFSWLEKNKFYYEETLCLATATSLYYWHSAALIF